MEYFRDIVITAALCGIVISLTPQTEKGTGKYVKYLTSLVLLLVLLTPLTALRASADQITNAVRGFFSASESTVQDTYSAAITMNASALSDGITASLCEKFNLAPDDLTVSLTLDTADPSALAVTSVDIQLRTNTDPTAVRSYVRSLGFETCTVTKGATP